MKAKLAPDASASGGAIPREPAPANTASGNPASGNPASGKPVPSAQCPAARALECVGEGWSILILRDAFHGFTRFDEFQKSLGIAPNILSRRLAHLTEAGLLERRRYCERPPRDDYVLTGKGRDFFPVIAALVAWGNRHLAPEGAALLFAERGTARPLEPVLVDAASLRPIAPAGVALVPGPAAGPDMLTRLAAVRAIGADDKDSRAIGAGDGDLRAIGADDRDSRALGADDRDSRAPGADATDPPHRKPSCAASS